MKVYGDGLYAQVFGKSEQPIYKPAEKQESNPQIIVPKSEKILKTKAPNYDSKRGKEKRERIAELLKDPNSKYHGSTQSVIVPKESRCNCPKCKKALEDYKARQKARHKAKKERLANETS